MEPIENTQEFMRGQQDCKDHKPHFSQGDEYDRGYNAQYSLDECRTKGFDHGRV